ncbi:ABC transporter G family member 11-like [Canna indica]|uniref:ABC transporter G family member 11-like n=1 Tax=Canna indica TaxID=4628 RepID=A0AAQ3Q0B5_9LILI|nr:ABC transporter G family member 11-like [Canna indica]
MANSPPVVPRWTPSPSPTRPLRPRATDGNDLEMHGLNAGSVDEAFFPFGHALTSPPPLNRPPHHHHVMEADHEVEMASGSLAGGNVVDEAGGREQQGVFLTWKDLWVTAADRKGGRVSILSAVTGYARPGEVLAIMGPSGCGKSTLLDALAGRLGSGVSQKGDILINGRRQKLAFGTSAYVTQDDVLMTTLTVREAVYYSAQLQLPDSMPRSVKRERAEATVREMGLEGAMDTRIGGWAVKGISGGQKRRVSICIELLTRPQLLFLDEPTSGLDSAASYHVMRRIAGLARREGMTVVTSIHQPSSEVFELFHGLCLLAYGKTVFFGPASLTNEFFASNGFPCPSHRNPSDHYLRTINKDFDKDIEEDSESNPRSTTEAIEILVKSYRSSVNSLRVTEQIAEICTAGGALVKKRNQASFSTQSMVLTRRSFVNMYRDLGYYWLRFAIYVALCLCVGTIYFDVGHSFGSIQARGSMLMFIAAFLTFMAIGGFPSFVEDMKIFGRERLNGHYGVAAFTIANTLSATPYLALISVIPGAIAYYLVGLQRSIDHFVYFTLVLFMCMMVVEGLMMIVASVVPDFLMGIITGAGIQGVMMLNGGFFRLPDDLPKAVWRYPMYYISFHKYANQGFYKNEFLGLTFPNEKAGGAPTITGEEIVRDIWQVEMGYSKWVNLGILLGMVILYRLMFLGIVKTVEKVKPMIKPLMARAERSTHVSEEASFENMA